MPRRPSFDHAEAIRRYQRNETQSAIGRALGVKQSAVRYALLKAGVPLRDDPRTGRPQAPRTRALAPPAEQSSAAEDTPPQAGGGSARDDERALERALRRIDQGASGESRDDRRARIQASIRNRHGARFARSVMPGRAA